MDYFFAQIEERENPQFKGKPVVVGADPKGGRGRGVVSTANYAARKYGIHSALPISKAFQLCPKAIFLPVNMELYQKVSERIMEIVKKYSETWEIVSLDEAYLDISFVKSYKGAKLFAEKLKEEILKKEKLTSTIGIGPNKLIAKMTSNKAKPNGLLIIKPKQVKKFLEPLNIEKLPGIGPKTAERLREIGVNKIKELKKLSKMRLKNIFGIVGETIYQRARGIDGEEVSSEEIIKSVGREHTFEKDTRDSGIIFEVFEKIIEDLHQELINNNLSFRTITVICRFQGFETHTKSKTLKNFTQDLEILKKEAKRLFLKFLVENTKLIRLIGLRITVV
jgi:DNA polymerase IV (DinB-like DNA polymerase)